MISPGDPASGGTWLGANDAGLVACLLNANPQVAGEPCWRCERASRGEIVPKLLAAATLGDALGLVRTIDADRYPPFRLLVLNSKQLMVAASDGQRLLVDEPSRVRSPLLFTSSGLGDHLVEGPRRELFERLLSGARDRIAAQTAYHNHRWREAPHISVLMQRADARTVSQTLVDLHPESAVLTSTRLDDRLQPDGDSSTAELVVTTAELVG